MTKPLAEVLGSSTAVVSLQNSVRNAATVREHWAPGTYSPASSASTSCPVAKVSFTVGCEGRVRLHL